MSKEKCVGDSLVGEGTFFVNRFPSLGNLVNEKVGIWKKTKPTHYSTFKTDITKMCLVFSISNFFINKISQGRKSVHGLAAFI